MPVPSTPSRAQLKEQWEKLEPLTVMENHLVGRGMLRLNGVLLMRTYGIEHPADLAFMFFNAAEADQQGMDTSVHPDTPKFIEELLCDFFRS